MYVFCSLDICSEKVTAVPVLSSCDNAHNFLEQLKSESKKIRQSQKLKIVQNPQFWFNQADFPVTLST